jgi:hypothetical protein
MTVRFRKVFGPRVKALDLASTPSEPVADAGGEMTLIYTTEFGDDPGTFWPTSGQGMRILDVRTD